MYKKIKISRNFLISVFLLLYSFATKYFVSIYSVRYHRYLTNFDGAIQYLVGREVIRGAVLYKDIFDQKTPYIFFLTGLASLIDYRHIGLFILEVIVLWSDLWFIYKILKIHFRFENGSLIIDRDERWIELFAIFGAIIMTLVLLFQPFNFGYNKTESYAVCFMLPGYYLFAKYFFGLRVHDDYPFDSPEFPPKDMFLIGICAAMAFMTNIRAVTIFAPFALVVAFILFKNKCFVNLLKVAVAGLLGVFITILPYIIYVIVTDSFADMWYALVDANINYAMENNINHYNIWQNILAAHKEFAIFLIVLYVTFIIICVVKYDIYLKIGTALSLFVAYAYIMFQNRTSNYYWMTVLPYLLAIYIVVIKLFAKRTRIFHTNKWSYKKNQLMKFYPICLALIVLYGHGMYYQNTLFFADLDALQKAAAFHKSIVTHFGSIKDLKILSYGFNMDVYMYLDARIHYKYFFIPSISYYVDKKAYEAQVSYIEEQDPDVFIYRGDAINSEMPPSEAEKLYNLINDKYYVVDTVKSLDMARNPEDPGYYIMARKTDEIKKLEQERMEEELNKIPYNVFSAPLKEQFNTAMSQYSTTKDMQNETFNVAESEIIG